MTEDRLLTVDEVAERTRVQPRTVRRWLREGRLHGILLGGRKTGYRVKESDLEKFIAEAPSNVEKKAS
jgi:excisionase family DNA binding protein